MNNNEKLKQLKERSKRNNKPISKEKLIITFKSNKIETAPLIENNAGKLKFKNANSDKTTTTASLSNNTKDKIENNLTQRQAYLLYKEKYIDEK